MKKLLLVSVVAALLLIPFIVFAADTANTDTPFGTSIISDGANTQLRYTDSGNTVKAVVTAETVVTNVTAEYGCATLDNLPGNASIRPTTTEVYTYVLTNEGNNSDNYYKYYSVAFSGGAKEAKLWKIDIKEGSDVASLTNKVTLETGATASEERQLLTEDANRVIQVTVIPSTLEANSPNGSYAQVTVLITTESRPAGRYQGANELWYGGTWETSDDTVTTVETGVMRMTRTSTVDAPTGHKTNGGKMHDAVPGSVISYTIVVTNDGSVPAQKVVLIDKVPTSTEAFHMGRFGAVTNAILSTEATVNPDNWALYYTISDTPLMTYEAAGNGWTSTTDASYIPKEAKYVKWQTSEARAGSGSTSRFTWGVTIK